MYGNKEMIGVENKHVDQPDSEPKTEKSRSVSRNQEAGYQTKDKEKQPQPC